MIVTRSLRVRRNRRIVARIRCPRENGVCEGRLRIIRNGRLLASSGFLVRGGRSGRVVLRVSRRQFRSLRRSQRVRVTAFSRDSAGTASDSGKQVRLTKPRPRR